MSKSNGSGAVRLPDPWEAVLAVTLRRLRAGEVVVHTPEGRRHRFVGAAPGPVAELRLRDHSVARRTLFHAGIGLAEGYMDGSWDTPDLDAVLDLGRVNLSLGWPSRVQSMPRPVQRLRHALRDNDARGGARRNISYHYDLGNDFYKLWLDDTMTYSSACVDDVPTPLTGERLELAQRRKWDRILELVQPGARDHLLEIGCGWGGFAIHAAREAGCRVTGITLSEAQAELARSRVREQGLEDRIDIRLEDYRHVPGTFSAITSIEMFEAVGEKWWPVFFARLRELLRPGGAAGIQVITLADDLFGHYRRHPDFIQRYIFPGGMLPSPERFLAAAEAAALRAGEPRFFGNDYERTLAAWSQRFEAALPQVRELGFDERFIRMWRYYYAYCRTCFRQGATNVMQVRLER